jgi:CheY-like chemotaxis protein
MKKILLVDDYKLSRDMIQKLLQDRNYEVDTAKNGEECLTRMAQNSYDLILIDLVLRDTDTNTLVKTLDPARTAVLYTIGSESLLEPLKKMGLTQFILKSTTDQNSLIAEITRLCPAD